MNTLPLKTRLKSELERNGSQFSIDRFKRLYQQFDRDALTQLPQLYSDNVVFKDPVHQISGLPALTMYFSQFCNSDTTCHFDFTNQIVGNNQVFFQWQMYYSHPRLQHGLPLTLNGGTLIKFNSLITYHEDFYDMGAMIYQHLPVLGQVVKKINTRIAGNIQ